MNTIKSQLLTLSLIVLVIVVIFRTGSDVNITRFDSQRTALFQLLAELPQSDQTSQSIVAVESNDTIIILFSVTCSHCRNSIESWERLIEEARGDGISVYVVSVNNHVLSDQYVLGTFRDQILVDSRGRVMKMIHASEIPWWIVTSKTSYDWLVKHKSQVKESLYIK